MIQNRSILAFTFVLLALFQVSTQKTFPRLPIEVLNVMGGKAMRYHHFLWHNLRELWPVIDNATQQAIAALGWAPPRPSMIPGPDGVPIANEDNFSGEDFLYMHKQMVKQTNEILARVNGTYQKVVGFSRFPSPNDTDYPIPCPYNIPGEENIGFTKQVADVKSDDFYYKTIVPAENAIRDAETLKKLNLGQLGARLEYTIHNWMHMRFSKKTPFGIRVPVLNPIPNIDPKWEDLSYQWLSDTFSSHVNPTFWRIHGWVEDRIEDWRVANNITEIHWEHKWEGGSSASVADLVAASANSTGAQQDAEAASGGSRLLQEGESEGHMGHHSVETMEKVIQLLMTATDCKESPMYKIVKVTPWV